MKLQVRSQASPEAIEKLIGSPAHLDHAPILLSRDATVFKPNGERLVTLRKAAVSEEAASAAYPFFHWLRQTPITRNRGAFAGERHFKVRRDGRVSQTDEAPPVHSSIVGFADRTARMPFCRACVLSSRSPEAWAACLPLIEEVSRIFEREVPDRFAAQSARARATHPAYVIAQTPFTTLTVNNTIAGAYHRDAGDFRPGFGVMLVLRRGTYRGGELVLPAFGVGVDLEDRDVLLFDVHEVHGNVPFHGMVGKAGRPKSGGYERISVVFYYRDRMTECGAPEEELARAKARGTLEKKP